MTTRQNITLVAVLVTLARVLCAANDPQVQWLFERSDCQANILRHATDETSETLSGKAEHIQIRGGAGTFCYFSKPTEKSHVIEDYDARLRIRANEAGITAYARVVFPNVVDEESKRPVSVLLLCDTYDQAGVWQELRINKLPDRLQEHIRFVRFQHGRHVDVSGSYIDGHVLNVFSGPGTTDVWIGESHVTGCIPLENVRSGVSTRPRNEISSDAIKKRPRATIDAGRLRLGETLFVPFVLDYNGEPLELVAQLGFNTLSLKHLPNREFLRDLELHDLWVVCPPPFEHEMRSTHEMDRVIFWDLGTVDRSPTLKFSHAIERMRRIDPRDRLLVARGENDGDANPNGVASLRRVARFADIVVTDFRESDQTLVESFEALQSRIDATGPSARFWTIVDTNQALFAESGVELLLATVAAGANGIWFRSDRPLHNKDPETTLRRATIAAGTLKLQSIRPWIVGVDRRQIISRTQYPDVSRIVQLETNDAALLLTVCDGVSSDGSVAVTTPALSESSDAFQLLPTGLRPLNAKRVSGGLAITLHKSEPTTPIVVTENRLATNQLARFTSATRNRSLAAERELAEASVRLARVQLRQETTGASFHAAEQHYDRGQRLLKTGDATNAYQAFLNARRELHRR
ncbi:MAG: hypothetical protein KDB27_24935 [Planctomycetales bacterium]|nr:hypothetical protein [Planctomycetales bacterium]